MALLKEIENRVGQTYSYFRIKEINCDFDNGYVTAVVDVYTSATQRDREKEQLNVINAKITLFEEYEALTEEEKCSLADEQQKEYAQLQADAPELYQRKIEKFSLFTVTIPFKITDSIDLRSDLYNLISTEQNFNGAEKYLILWE